MPRPQTLARLALGALSLCALVGCEHPLLGDWDVEEARDQSYPIEEGGEACTTRVTADLDLRERSEGVGGDYNERTTLTCRDQSFADRVAWDVEVEEIERGVWRLDLTDAEAQDVTLECSLEDDTRLACTDTATDEGWLFVRVEGDD